MAVAVVIVESETGMRYQQSQWESSQNLLALLDESA